MTRLLWLALGLLLGYAARRPVCEREHRLPRRLDPAIVRQPPEGDEGIQPPDPRTWPVLCVCGTVTGGAVIHRPTCPMYGSSWTRTAMLHTSDGALSGGFVHPKLGVAALRESWDPKAVPEPAPPPVQPPTWPDTLEHWGAHVPGEFTPGCPRCSAARWLRRGARPA